MGSSTVSELRVRFVMSGNKECQGGIEGAKKWQRIFTFYGCEARGGRTDEGETTNSPCKNSKTCFFGMVS